MELTPELRAFIQRVIQEGTIGGDGRSPIRPRQLHDLNAKPAHNDPRPLFVWSAEKPVDFQPGPFQLYPRLMWHRDTGDEITVQDAIQERMMTNLYTTEPPANRVIDPYADLKIALEGLSEQERDAVLKGQQEDRMHQIRTALAQLTPEQVQKLAAQAQEPDTVKRGPGRPKKTAA